MQRTAPLSPQYLAANPLSKESKTGIPYFLPDTVVPVTVSGDFVLLPERKSDKPSPSDYEYVITVSIGASKQIADPNAALLLEYVPEIASDDVFNLGVGTNGLLSNVKSTSTDQSAAIILKLVELAKEAIKLPFAFPAGVRSASLGPTDDDRRTACYNILQKMSVTTEIDLSDLLRFEAAYSYLATATRSGPSGWQYSGATAADQELADQYARYLWSLQTQVEPFSLNATANAFGMFQNSAMAASAIIAKQVALLNKSALLAMQKAPVAIDLADRPVRTINFQGKPSFPVPGSVALTPPYVTPGAKAYAGIVFRVMAPRRLSIAVDTEGLKFGNCTLRNVAAYSDGATLMVADPVHTFVADNNRGVFVKKRVDFVVSDGVLTGIEVDKPSELLAIVSLPVDILKAIASIPGEILSVKIKQLSDEKGLTSAQVELLKSQIDLIKQKQALSDAQKGSQ
jgi:hypothetical protein